MATGYLDVCRFLATSNGTADFVPLSAVTGYQTPAQAGAVDATRYYYRAESSDLTQWEVGYGNYTVSSTTLARTTILFSSNSNSKVNFTAAPQVCIVAVAETLVPQSIGQLPGTATNDSASAGNVGEAQIAKLAVGSAVSLTNSTPAAILSLALTAGDWDVSGLLRFTGGSTTTMTIVIGIISPTSASLTDTDFGPQAIYLGGATVFSSASQGPAIAIPTTRVLLNTTTTYYFNGYAVFGTSTCSAFGYMLARRIR